MRLLYQAFGYAGAIPFWFFTWLIYSQVGYENSIIPFSLQIAYGGMILSFLAGLHWAHGLPRGYHFQILLSMLPTITILGLLAAIHYTAIDPVLVSVLTGWAFWALYGMDKHFLEPAWLPESYFRFRFFLTFIVSASFFVLPVLVLLS